MEFIIEHGELMQDLFKRGIKTKLPSGITYEIPKQITFDLEDLKCASVTECTLSIANKGDSIAWLYFWELAYPIDAITINPFGTEDGELDEDWRFTLAEVGVKIIDKIINVNSIIFKVDYVEDMLMTFQINVRQLPHKTLTKLKEAKLEWVEKWEEFTFTAKNWNPRHRTTPRKGEFVTIDILQQLCGDGDIYISKENKTCKEILSIINKDIWGGKIVDVIYKNGEGTTYIEYMLDIEEYSN